jgi:glutaminyl-tRNA synthetase
MNDLSPSAPTNFIRAIIEEDLASGRFSHVHTRFPPEPNGYLHIGHCKAIIIDFGTARDYGGKCNLRFDDTNPVKEDVEYVNSIKEDIRWLGFDWEEREFYASDYFEQLYQFAIQLIGKGRAYVDDLSAEEIRLYRGTLTEPGRESPYRNRSVAQNLDLFQRMRAGEFPDGACVLRAKIDMASGNMNLRDPVMYRIIHEPPHHRTGYEWCIYPMYDFAHGQCDSIEGITHSLCSLEYEDHRPLYDWFLDELEIFHPRQIEFARLNLSYTVVSKRKLIKLVKEGYVRGWDDPRMPTISAMRRRGFTPSAIHDFIQRAGVAKNPTVSEISLLEHCVLEDLNRTSQRVMGVLKPLKVVLLNYPPDQVEFLEAVNNPEDPSAGTRQLPFGRELFIEQDDFREVPPPKYFRLSPGKEVRLRYGYFIKCVEVIKNEHGQVIELRCTYDPATRGGYAPDGRKVQGTLHWVSADHSVEAEVRLYDRLFTKTDPGDVEEGDSYLNYVNPNSLSVITGCQVEPGLAHARPGERFQFERQGYFCVDTDTAPGRLVFNLTVSLRDSWAKIAGKQASAVR